MDDPKWLQMYTGSIITLLIILIIYLNSTLCQICDVLIAMLFQQCVIVCYNREGSQTWTKPLHSDSLVDLTLYYSTTHMS